MVREKNFSPVTTVNKETGEENRVDRFSYILPEELIAHHPAGRRDESRLMVCRRNTKAVEHRRFHHITDYFKEGDLLLLNDTKVIPARLRGKKATGGAVEVLLVRQLAGGKQEQQWAAMVRPSRGVKTGTAITFDGGLQAEVTSRGDDGWWRLSLSAGGPIDTIIHEVGRMPLPPYIRRETTEEDRERYQTVFAKKEGAIAAPTAGLHFTDTILARLREQGVDIRFITLHTGPGTFLPLRAKVVEEHSMIPEYYEIDESTFSAVEEAKKEGRRVIAVGSTATRAIEASVRNGFSHPALTGFTDLFIYPGYTFRVIDGLVTNFHLPRSTLIMLVAAFAGREATLNLYKEAVRKRYRFYSYGDAMMLI